MVNIFFKIEEMNAMNIEKQKTEIILYEIQKIKTDMESTLSHLENLILKYTDISKNTIYIIEEIIEEIIIEPNIIFIEEIIIEPTSIEFDIVCWNETMNLLEYLNDTYKSPSYINICDTFHTLDMDFGTIFDTNHVSLWIDNFENQVICNIMYFKNGTWIANTIINFDKDNLKNITRKLRKMLK